MSVTKYVVGIIPQTEQIAKKKAIYDSCRELGVVPPDELVELFDSPDGSYIEGLGRTVGVEAKEGHNNALAMEWLVANLNDIPDGITAIAFIESY